MSNVIFKSVCFLTIFVLAFFGVFGGFFGGSKLVYADWYENIVDTVNAIANAASLVANLTGADWLGEIAGYLSTITNLYQTFTTNANTQDKMDKLMRDLLRTTLNEFHKLLVDYINSGGDPKVIENYHKEFENLASRAGAAFLSALAGVDLCNKDWSARIELLLPSSPPKIKDAFKCSLSDIAKKMQSAKVTVSFRQISFDDFAAMLEPKNNFLGTYLMAAGEKSIKEYNAVEVGKVEIIGGQGTRSAKNSAGEKDDPANDKIKTPGSLVGKMLQDSATKDYDLWARQLAAVTPYRGKSGTIEILNLFVSMASSMASLIINKGLTDVSGDEAGSPSYDDVTLDTSKSDAASSDVSDSSSVADTLENIKDSLETTTEELDKIVPVLQDIVNKEKDLANLIVSQLNGYNSASCDLSDNPFSEYLTISKSKDGESTATTSTTTETQTETDTSGNSYDVEVTVTTTTTITKYKISVSDAETGDDYIDEATLTETITETTYSNSTTSATTVQYSLDSSSVDPSHQDELEEYQGYQTSYANLNSQIDYAISSLETLETAAQAYADASCDTSTTNGEENATDSNCDSLESDYNWKKLAAVVEIQKVIKTLSGEYAYASSSEEGTEWDINGDGTTSDDEKQLEDDLDDLKDELSDLYDDLYDLYEELTTEQVDAAASGAQESDYVKYCSSSKGFYATKYCLNDAYSNASGVSCSQ